MYSVCTCRYRSYFVVIYYLLSLYWDGCFPQTFTVGPGLSGGLYSSDGLKALGETGGSPPGVALGSEAFLLCIHLTTETVFSEFNHSLCCY